MYGILNMYISVSNAKMSKVLKADIAQEIIAALKNIEIAIKDFRRAMYTFLKTTEYLQCIFMISIESYR